MENQPKPLKTHKNQHGTMKNQSGTIKTNLELDRVVMGGSGGYSRLPGGSDHFSLQNCIIIYISATFLGVVQIQNRDQAQINFLGNAMLFYCTSEPLSAFLPLLLSEKPVRQNRVKAWSGASSKNDPTHASSYNLHLKMYKYEGKDGLKPSSHFKPKAFV